ncbi:TIGR04104 family putative zinc finger protein [Ornithinibacillus bavariensis]|uniref:TIGR04104 family putative zinc finger protein n=1 Tax=Ornithinibacillus bavariensis TaxID=545502 RepID=UPI001BB45880|nr:TIGR04104 family putative zinc finger protein [Ornithinibacillus bavariensis]
MPTCKSCGTEWAWKQTVKKTFSNMKCPHCGEKQYLTARSRKKSSVVAFLAPLTLLFSFIVNFSSIVTIILLIGLSIVWFGLSPCIVELSNEEEPLW